MIPVPNLDDEFFDEINENARNMISRVCPQWTDYNKHDSGITFIELFSWFKEIQQYYLNNISAGMKEKYLMMLGMKRFTKKCAVLISEGINSLDKDVIIPADSRIFADDICFETSETEFIQNNEIENIILNDGEIKKFSSEADRLVINRMMYILPFGSECRTGDTFEITFRKKLPYGSQFSLYFSVFNDYPVKRNPVYDSGTFIPLAEIEISCLTVNGWQKADIIYDETYCFIQSGNIRIEIPENTADMKYDNGYRIRFMLKKCDYEIPPAITEVKMNILKLFQKKTLASYYDAESMEEFELILPFTENSLSGKIDVYFRYGEKFIKYDNFRTDICNNGINRKIVFSKLLKKNFDSIRVVIYDNDFYENKSLSKGTGFPYQELLLERNTVMAESFNLMIYDKFENAFYEWCRKDNFDTSGPESRDFVFDEISGTIRFGNGERGLSPDGEIIISECVETLAQNGNIKSSGLISTKYNGISFDTVKTVENGCEAEKYEDCIKRFISFMETPEKNVTFEDFEKCVYNTQGLMIRQCRAVTAKPFNHTNGIILIVQPYSDCEKPKLNGAYTENILRSIEKRKLIGTKVNVVSCQYIGVDIYAEVCIKSHYVNAYDTIKNTVSNLFENNSLSLGDTISYSSIYHLIDALECVNYVKLLNITASGANYEISDNGDIILSENGIAYLNSASYTISENR